MAGLVQRERQLQPRLGTRKLYHLLKPELKEAGVRMGRDRMFEELRERDLLLEPVPAEYPHTTQSYHNLPVFRNLDQGPGGHGAQPGVGQRHHLSADAGRLSCIWR